jgi:riboflavin biosynthesis pyrimidine reductase
VQDFAMIWRAAAKIVYSTTLDSVSAHRTKLERDFRPDPVRRLKSRSKRNLSVGGATLAGRAMDAGLVDEVRLFLTPVVVGGGLAAFSDDARQQLDLVEERRFGGGTVFLRYRVRP